MNEEIKNILDYFKRSDKNKFGFEQGKLIDYEEAQLLLDYITNLQQENEILKQNNQSYQEEMARTWEIADNYKSRCEKATEYINHYLKGINNLDDVLINSNILKEIDVILNGDDE